jgi:hypothetical protein
MGWIDNSLLGHCKPYANKPGDSPVLGAKQGLARRDPAGLLHMGNNFIGELGRAYLACALHFAGKIAGHALG